MTPFVSIIVPFHNPNNQRYLDLLFYSLKFNTDLPLEVVLVPTEGIVPKVPETPPNVVVHINTMPGESTFAKKINYGVRHSNPASKYILLTSDDVFFGKNAILNMAKSCEDYGIVLNALSNCDNITFFYTKFEIEKDGQKRTLDRFLRYEDIEGCVDQIINMPVGPNIIFNQSAVHFYNTMIPRKVWEVVGELDEKFRTGYEDTDYCRRAILHRFGSYITTGAFVFHFGGVTSSDTVTQNDRDFNRDYFDQKWNPK